MYLGQLDSRKESAASPQHGVFPGWSPNRDPSSKWHLPQETLPDAYAPLGVRWARCGRAWGGWGVGQWGGLAPAPAL